MNTSITATITSCIANIREVLPDYWTGTLNQRLPGGAGSIVSGFTTPDELEAALLGANWEPYSHEALMPGTRAFVTRDIVGTEGIISLASLPGDTPVVLDDRKGTGKVSATVAGFPGKSVDFTVIILGDHDGREVVFTFHPGDPVPPSKVEATPGLHGKEVTAAGALTMGLTTAKVV